MLMYAGTDFPVAEAMKRKITSDSEVMILTGRPPPGHGCKEDKKNIKMRRADPVDSQYCTWLVSLHISDVLSISFDSKCVPTLSFLETLTTLVTPTSLKFKKLYGYHNRITFKMFWVNKAIVWLTASAVWQLCVPNSMCFNLNSWHLLAVGFSRQKSPNTTGRSNNFSLAFSPVSWQPYSVCLLYGCRQLHLHISFVFWQRLMCFDAVPSVMWIWMGCIQRLACQGENDPDWQRDDLSLSPTIPFQVSPWNRTHTPTGSSCLSDWTPRQSLHFNSFPAGSLATVLICWS